MGVQINQLASTTPSSGQNLPVYDPSKGDVRRFALSDLSSWLETLLPLGRPEPNTQYGSPNTGDTVVVFSNNEDTHLILTPIIGLVNLTIRLPANGAVRDKQLVLVNCSQAVTNLTIDGNGSSVSTGAPTTLAANSYFTLKYDITANIWYRIA